MSTVAMGIDDLEKDLPEEPSSREVAVLEETSNPLNSGFGVSSYSICHQQSHSRKRKEHPENNSGGDEKKASSGDPEQALRVLHAEEYPAAVQNNGPQSVLVGGHLGQHCSGDEDNFPPSVLGYLHIEEICTGDDLDRPALKAKLLPVEEHSSGLHNNEPQAALAQSLLEKHSADEQDNFPPSELVSSHLEENSTGGGINDLRGPSLEALHVKNNPNGDGNCGPLSGLRDSSHDEEMASGDENTIYPLSPLRTPHIEENLAGDGNKATFGDANQTDLRASSHDEGNPVGEDNKYPLSPLRAPRVEEILCEDENKANLRHSNQPALRGSTRHEEYSAGDANKYPLSPAPHVEENVGGDDVKASLKADNQPAQRVSSHDEESPAGDYNKYTLSPIRAPHVQVDLGDDENRASLGDCKQLVSRTSSHDEEYPAGADNNYPLSALAASHVEENVSGDEIKVSLRDDIQSAQRASSHDEENPAGDYSNYPLSPLSASNVEENPVEDENNASFRAANQSGLESLHFKESPAGDENKELVAIDPLSPLRTPHVEENLGGNENEASIKEEKPTFEVLLFEENCSGDANQAQLKALHVVENSGKDEMEVLVGDTQPEVDRSPLQVGETSEEEDPRSLSRKRMLILMPAVAAMFSALAGSLASVGELLLLLQGTGTSMPSESSLVRYYSGMGRSSGSLLDNNNLLILLFLLMQHRRRSQKRPRELTGPWYIKPRPIQGVESFLDFSPQSDPEKFRELFRIGPELFDYICEMVSDEMLSDTPRSLRVLPNRVLTVQRQVAIAVRRLATGNQFLGIADSFGVSKSTAVKVTWKFIVAFIKKARQQHLRWPQGETMQQVKDGFKAQYGFPNCCGVVDGTHFTVEFPKGEDVTSYYDHQDHVSISMQVIVDHDLRFLDVVVGWPGSVQDYQLMQNTSFFQSVVHIKDRLNGDAYTTHDGSSLTEYIIGDAAYPLYDWLMVPYPSGVSAAKDEWNSRHAAARLCVENALGRLKGTWRILSRILWKPRKERIGKMVFACCLLHNMIIERQDTLNPEVYAGVNPHPGGYTGVSVPTMDVFEGGMEARDVLFREVMGGGII